MTIDTADLVDRLCEIDPMSIKYSEDVQEIEKQYGCAISCDTEKHNALQYTHYYEVDFGEQGKFYVEIENGINNGTQVNNEDWDVDTKSDTKTVEVLKDIVLDENFYSKNPDLRRKAQALLDSRKAELFTEYRQNNYDNYVTGSNSKMKMDPIFAQLELDYIHEDIEVDRNFI